MGPSGTLRGTLRRPSMSSENACRRVGPPVRCSKARRTKLVRATSAKVPMWGRPLGPYPVWNRTERSAAGERRSRMPSASAKGQAAFEATAALAVAEGDAAPAQVIWREGDGDLVPGRTRM